MKVHIEYDDFGEYVEILEEEREDRYHESGSGKKTEYGVA